MKKQYYVRDKLLFEVITGKYWLVEVTEVRQAYGKTRYGIKPVNSDGDVIIVEGHNLTAIKK